MISSDEAAALILAAGLSSRMGRFKPLIDIDGRRLIEHVVDGIRKAGIERIRVVIGFKARRLNRVLENIGVKGVLNQDYRGEMFSSLKVGVAALSGSCRAFFMLPGDMPFVRPQTYRELLAAFEPDRMDMMRPCNRDRIGHPVLISATKIAAIAAYDGHGGLRSLVRRQEWRIADLDCADPGILVDLDKPEDLVKIGHRDRPFKKDRPDQTAF